MRDRSYQGLTDQALMLELVHRHPESNLHVIDLPYRLSSWALDDPENARLWFDGDGTLRAWAVVQSPFWSIDYAVDTLDPDLPGAVLDWAVQRAQALKGNPFYARPAWFVSVLAGQTGAMQTLAAKGFTDQMHVAEDPWSKVFMSRPADPPLEMPTLPPGYRLRALQGEAEISAYVALQRAVFESENMTDAWRTRVLRQPAYRPELNLTVEDPNGALVGFCVGWFDPSGPGGRPAGQIEPMGVSAPQRGLGLGKALLGQCIRHMRELGAETVYLETDNFRDQALLLYESAGFSVLHPVHVFRKDF